MTAKLAVTGTRTRRFIERWAPFSIPVNVAVLFQPFAAMELRVALGMDRERESLTPPVAVHVAICALVWKKWINRPPGTLSALFRAIWRKQSSNQTENVRHPKRSRQGR